MWLRLGGAYRRPDGWEFIVHVLTTPAGRPWLSWYITFCPDCRMPAKTRWRS